MSRADVRMFWVMERSARWRKDGTGFLVAWYEDVVDDFVEAFPEAEKALVYYLMGPNSCPMLNRAAARARDLRYFEPGVVGNPDARSFNQRTWCRCWTLTPRGRRALDVHLKETRK